MILKKKDQQKRDKLQQEHQARCEQLMEQLRLKEEQVEALRLS